MKMVYIASPFRGDCETNLKNVMKYCQIAGNLGVLPVAPHIMYSGWCRDEIPEEREMGLKLGLELLGRSDELWVMGRNHSEGMKGEISHAKEQNIPIYYVPEPENLNGYPVSADHNQLLCRQDCDTEGMAEDITGELIVIDYQRLKAEHRTPLNQIWRVTHGPGCRLGSFSGTVHVQHPVDQDGMVLERSEIWGLASIKTMERLVDLYPALGQRLNQQTQAGLAEEFEQ